MAVHGGIMPETAIIDGALAYVYACRSWLGQGPPELGELYKATSASLEEIADELGASLSNTGWFGTAGTRCVEQGRALAMSVRSLAAIDLQLQTLIAEQAQEVIAARTTMDEIAAELHQQKVMAVNLANCGCVEASIAVQTNAEAYASRCRQSAVDKLRGAAADHAAGITGLCEVFDGLLQESLGSVFSQVGGTFDIDLESLRSMVSALNVCCVKLRMVANYGGIEAAVRGTHGSAYTEPFNSALAQYESRRADVLRVMAEKADVYSDRLLRSNVLFADCDEMAAESLGGV